jgi:hypothetical protein
MTVQETIDRALRLLGLRNITATEYTEAISSLNTMLSSWEELLHYPVSENFTITSGVSIYSIGSGADFDTTRPFNLVSAFLRDSDNIDYFVDVKMTQTEYNRTMNKSLSARPQKIFYNPTYPVGYIYFDSTPNNDDTLYLTSIKPYDNYSSLTDNITLPPEWDKAVIYNLAIDLAPEHNQTPSQLVYEQATLFLNRIGARNMDISESIIESEIRRGNSNYY